MNTDQHWAHVIPNHVTFIWCCPTIRVLLKRMPFVAYKVEEIFFDSLNKCNFKCNVTRGGLIKDIRLID